MSEQKQYNLPAAFNKSSGYVGAAVYFGVMAAGVDIPVVEALKATVFALPAAYCSYKAFRKFAEGLEVPIETPQQKIEP